MVKMKVVSMGFGYKYFGEKLISSLDGPSASARDFKQFLIDYHDFEESDIRLIVDDEDPSNIPTAQEILEIIREQFANAEAGDTMVLHMCGHGERMQTDFGNNSAYIEMFICGGPKDQSGIRSRTEVTGLCDINLREVCRVPEGCNLTVIADCCTSGGLVEGVNEIVGISTECPKAVNLDTPVQLPSNAILLSACQSGDITGAAYSVSKQKKVGYFTESIMKAFKAHGRFQSVQQVFGEAGACLSADSDQLFGLYCSPTQMNNQFLGHSQFISKIDWPTLNKYRILAISATSALSITHMLEEFRNAKHQWPVRLETFDHLVKLGTQNDDNCISCMHILDTLLSEEYFSSPSNAENSLNREFQIIHELCLFVLSNFNNGRVINVTLTTLQRFISLIPLNCIVASSTVETLLMLFKKSEFRFPALPCLTEVASIQFPDFYDKIHVKMHATVLNAWQMIKPLFMIDSVTYACYTSAEKVFIKNLARFFTSFYKAHIHILETDAKNIESLQLGLDFLIMISYVDDIDISMVCLQYWRSLVSELRLSESAPQFYANTLSKLGLLMISRMAIPDDFLLVENSNGDIVRKALTDNDVLRQYQIMKDTIRELVNLHLVDIKTEIQKKICEQEETLNWKLRNSKLDSLNSLCWAIGSISGSFSNSKEELTFLSGVFPALLRITKQMKGTSNRSIAACNFLYVIGQYPTLIERESIYLQDIVLVLLKFMVETCPAIQDMACCTFMKMAEMCTRELVTLVPIILADLQTITADLAPNNVYTFYESVAYLIERSDAQKRVQYLEDLMLIPNQQWHALIEKASLINGFLDGEDAALDVLHILQMNTSVASRFGMFFRYQLEQFLFSILHVYRFYSDFIHHRFSGRISLLSKELNLQYSVKIEILKLMKTSLDKAQYLLPEQHDVMNMIVILNEVYWNCAPREPEFLSLIASIVPRYQERVATVVYSTMEGPVKLAFELLEANYEADHFLELFNLLEKIAMYCPSAVYRMSYKDLAFVINSLLRLFQHTEIDICEEGLQLVLNLINMKPEIEQLPMFFMDIWILVLTLYIKFPQRTDSLIALLYPLCIEVKYYWLGDPSYGHRSWAHPTLIYDETISLITSLTTMTRERAHQYIQAMIEAASCSLTTFEKFVENYNVSVEEGLHQDMEIDAQDMEIG